MNRALVDKIAGALLYEGYILYPYRPSVKNRQRWTFGGLYPQTWSDAQNGTDPFMTQTECLVSGKGDATLQLAVRFLHLLDRTVGKLAQPLAHMPVGSEPEFQPVDSLDVGDKQHQPWQEAVERDVDLGEFSVKELIAAPIHRTFTFSESRAIEPLRAPGGEIVGVLVRQQQAISAEAEVFAAHVAHGLCKITVRVFNRTSLSPDGMSRDRALMRALVSTHLVLGVRDGEFVSLMDPPDPWRAQVAACKNIGTWPILIGEGTERDTMLASPIILYDYPQIAPESPGDLFDATEIDEILSLRIMTLTDEEKRGTGIDERASALLARTETLAREQLMGLHGKMRGLQPLTAEHGHE